MNNLQSILTSPLAKDAGKLFVHTTASTAGALTGIYAFGLVVQAVQDRKKKHAASEEN